MKKENIRMSFREALELMILSQTKAKPPKKPTSPTRSSSHWVEASFSWNERIDWFA